MKRGLRVTVELVAPCDHSIVVTAARALPRDGRAFHPEKVAANMARSAATEAWRFLEVHRCGFVSDANPNGTPPPSDAIL